MTLSEVPFSVGELLFIGGYLLSLLGIGWLGMRARTENSLRDFYLGGRGIGFLVLLMTLYATQYSGNTLFGFTGKTYRIGFRWAVCIHFMTAIVVFYLLFAPKLYRVARQHRFITPADYIQHRFGSRGLSLMATGIMVIGLANYLLAQLMAMGRALEGFTPQEREWSYIIGVMVLAAIIVVYETLGGFRAVAWTDLIQGGVLIIGFAVLVFLLFDHFGSLDAATRKLMTIAPEKVAPPNTKQACEWVSWIFLVGIGGALYPQAIQRIYAAKSATSLRKSLAIMAFLPLTTTLIAVIFGVVAAANPSSVTGEGDEVLALVCREIQQQSPVGRWLVVVLFAGILAALMSTADSVLLCISSMLTKDVYAVIYPNAQQQQLTRFGKICSWVLILLAVGLAIALREVTLVKLLKIKFELLLQLTPAFFIGIHWRGLQARPVTVGLMLGVVVAVALTLTGHNQLFGVHAGLYGLVVNLATAVGGSLVFAELGRKGQSTGTSLEQ